MIATPIKLPAKPRIRQKEQLPDQRQVTIVPIRAATDRSLTEMELRTLMVFCSYTNRSGLTWVGLKRISTHFGVSVPRMTKLTQGLIAKGYIKVLYKGFAGERAQTRQVIFNKLSVEDIVAVTSEPAPYMIEQSLKEQLNQPVKGQTMPKRKPKVINTVNDQPVSNLILNLNDGNKAKIESIKRIIGNDLFDAVMQNLPADASPQQIEAELQRMLG